MSRMWTTAVCTCGRCWMAIPMAWTCALRRSMRAGPTGAVTVKASSVARACVKLDVLKLWSWARAAVRHANNAAARRPEVGLRGRLLSAMRKLELKRDGLYINDKPVFMRLVLDRGSIPTAYTRLRATRRCWATYSWLWRWALMGARCMRRCLSRDSCTGRTAWGIWCGASSRTGASTYRIPAYWRRIRTNGWRLCGVT